MNAATPSLADPLWLLLLLALPLLAWRHHRRGARGALTFSELPQGAGGAWRLHLPFYSRLVALALLVLALARPQLGYAWEESTTEGVDIQLVLDMSGSMGAEDFAPKNRLEVAKKVIADFVAGRPGDRIGLVAFAGQALTQVPITTDYAVLEEAIRHLRIGILEDGTAIGTGIATAANRLRRAPGKSKVIVLLTDGENNAGTVDPRTAAQAAATFGIRIYTIGVGTEGEAPVPTGQGPLGLRYQTMPVKIDEVLLGEVARMTGGRYFRATDAQSLANIFGEINRLEKTPVQHLVYRRYDEAYRWPLGLGLLALALELVVSATFAVRVP